MISFALIIEDDILTQNLVTVLLNRCIHVTLVLYYFDVLDVDVFGRYKPTWVITI